MNPKETGNGGDYLWDGSGPSDPLVQSLERALAPLQHRGVPPELKLPAAPSAPPIDALEAHAPIPFRRSTARWAAAAMAALIALAALVGRSPRVPGFEVNSLSGMPRIGARAAGESTTLRIGAWLKTDTASAAEITVADIGHVTVKPESRIRIKSTAPGQHILELARGSIHATIYAPPRVFFVETPSARAIDMGCEYTMDVGDDGAGIIRVTLGHVLLEHGGRFADVPMLGGMCRMRPGFGPGTPYFDDAPAALIAALERFDFGHATESNLQTVINLAREKDALSLWHLLYRTTPSQRELVYDKLASLKPPPESSSREAVLKLDEIAMKSWWDHMRPF